MRNTTLETLIWVLIYGGLLTVSLAVFVGSSLTLLATALGILGVGATALGALLIWVRSRRKDDQA